MLYGNSFTANSATNPDSAAVHKWRYASALDDKGNPLTDPDTANTYSGNTPDDIRLE